MVMTMSGAINFCAGVRARPLTAHPFDLALHSGIITLESLPAWRGDYPGA